MKASDLYELVRLPAALTVPGDSLSGAACVPDQPRGRTMPVASAFLYWAGMALNDWADREIDAHERPERPIPSGRVRPETALAVGGTLGAAGIAASAIVGGSSALRMSIPLAGMVWTYDTLAKNSPAGPVVMASTRCLDVLLGAHTAPSAAWEPAATAAAHTVAVTALSRDEVHGSTPKRAAATTATSYAISTAATIRALTDRTARRRDRLASAACSVAYAGMVARAQGRAVRDTSPATVRTATATGIAGFPLLQASWLARRGRLGSAAAVVAARPLLRIASRRVSTT